MDCPRCGHQPISDAMRFCSYCGFKLGVVKASLADDDGSKKAPFTIQEVPKERQRDTNIGVILMFVGALLAALLAGRGGYLGREGGAIVLAVAFSFILLLSALTAGQDMPIPLFMAQRVTTAEILSPTSVTEQITNLLENK